jgi:AcrR family transcriptional regulator
MKALPPPADAADRIVHATLGCIEQDGIDGLTVRSIARAAGVNVAAMNYYFGTKDQLLSIVLERALDQAVRDPLLDFDRLRKEGKDARTALASVLDEVVANGVRQPRTTYAHLHGPIALQDYRRDAVIRANAFLELLLRRIGREMAARTTAAKRARLSQLQSTVLMASLAPHLFRTFLGFDLRDAKKRRAWIAALVDGLLIEAPKARRGRRSGTRSRSGARRRRR